MVERRECRVAGIRNRKFQTTLGSRQSDHPHGKFNLALHLFVWSLYKINNSMTSGVMQVIRVFNSSSVDKTLHPKLAVSTVCECVYECHLVLIGRWNLSSSPQCMNG